MATNIHTSIVIPTLNEEHNLPLLLDDIAIQTIKPKETIIVDAGSTDNTIAIASSYEFVTVIHSHPPVGHQRHSGGSKASTDYIFFIDADSRIEKNFIKNALEELASTNAPIAIPNYSPITKDSYIKLFYLLFNRAFKFFKHFAPSGAGMCIIVNNKVYKASKGFDQNLTYDDIELVRRLGKKHGLLVLNESVQVSTRRFQKFGKLHVTVHYLLLSLLFMPGWFRLANLIPYTFSSNSSDEIIHK